MPNISEQFETFSSELLLVALPFVDMGGAPCLDGVRFKIRGPSSCVFVLRFAAMVFSSGIDFSTKFADRKNPFMPMEDFEVALFGQDENKIAGRDQGEFA